MSVFRTPDQVVAYRVRGVNTCLILHIPLLYKSVLVFYSVKRTVSIPVDLPPERFLPLMQACAQIFNTHVDWAIEHGTYNKSKAHDALYFELRGKHPDVPSAFVQAMRDTAMEAVKATKFKRVCRKKPTSGLRYDKRTMTLRGKQLTLSSISGRVAVVLEVPDYFKEVFDDWDFKGATVTYDAQKRFWVRLVFETDSPALQPEQSLQGLDRGLYHLVSTSDGQFLSARKVRALQRRCLHNRKKLQQKGTRQAKRRLRAMSGREKRFMRDKNHCLSKKLARQPQFTTFVLEDLSGIRVKRRGKQLNKWLSSWTFHQFEMFLTYKAEALGKRVVFVDPRYTSQKCNRCHYTSKANRCKSRFHCKACGFKIHADINAAMNIRDNYILSCTFVSQEQGTVNCPNVSDIASRDKPLALC
jgi:putative transposase